MKKKLLSTLAAVGVVAAGGWWLMQGNQPMPNFSPVGAAEAQGAEVDPAVIADMSLGNPDASVTVIEYASFTCPHCAAFHANVMPQLKAEYIDTGKINYIHREVYFDRYGLWAGMLARCGGGERYFGLVDLLYDRQRDWAGSNDPAVVADNLRRLGRTAGLSNDQVDACLLDGDVAQALVEVYQTNATADDINSTPSFVINGQKYSNMAFSEMSGIIDGKLTD
jgi:protein-disulfide isomerase